MDVLAHTNHYHSSPRPIFCFYGVIEHSGYFEMKTDFVKVAKATKGDETIQFYDSNTGKLLYSAPHGRSMDDFLKESKAHGWPSFRDTEVS
jgi:hypothetical protein